LYIEACGLLGEIEVSSFAWSCIWYYCVLSEYENVTMSMCNILCMFLSVFAFLFFLAGCLHCSSLRWLFAVVLFGFDIYMHGCFHLPVLNSADSHVYVLPSECSIKPPHHPFPCPLSLTLFEKVNISYSISL
jgi:hypothetical protein